MNQKELTNLVNDISVEYFNKPYNDEVVFNNRLRTTGGRYIPKYRRIELNPKFLLEIGKVELIGIIKHELCHYHLHVEGKGYKHRDPEFRDLLMKTGSPRHCNTLPSAENKKKHVYCCIDCGNVYKRARRINQLNRYRCGVCKGKLKKV